MPSKHANAGLLIRRGLYDDLHSFAELEQRISALGDENTKIVGDALEVFVEGYLATHQKMQAEALWLVGQAPYDIREQLNLPNDAKGIDGIFRTRTGTLVPYQVKFRSARKYLTYTEVAPFLGLTERAADRIVFTNSNELAEDVKNRNKMRTVRGIDFDDLTSDDFKAISRWLREQPVAIPKLTPRDPDQIEALTRISETLAKSDRAHVVMASGTGKTMVALWAAEALKPKTVLVLLPSLTLLQQTLDEWSRQNSWGSSFTYLCVCSDPTVVAKDEYDPIKLYATDLDFHVDTDPDVVRRFVQRDTTDIKVMFSTYHSSPVVSEGCRGLAPIDVAIFDEAHKTTGFQGDLFAHSLSDQNVQIRKRLFFTATPRHYDIRHRDREGDFRIASMDDETIYGPRAYTLTFGEAARLGIICNYEVVISIVDGQEVNDFVLKHGITLVKGNLIRARWVANQIAVERAVEKTGAKRAISFHSRVSSAKEFSTDSAHGIKQFLPEFSVFHVNGEQKSSERKQTIRDFRDAPKALITNARCLTEGIDVPAVDMVAFIDPRHSKIDIAQATGRAMRKASSDKSVGYVVIPLFLDRREGETLEEALARTEFDDIADVLNAIKEQDEELVEIVCELMQAKGRGAKFDPQPLADKITVLGPTIDLTTLRTNIFIDIIDTLGSYWDEMYGRLVTFFKTYGHSNVPQRYEDKQLGNWVKKLRWKKNRLSAGRVALLDKLNFVWNAHDAKWDEMYDQLASFYKENGHARIPTNHPNLKLYRWANTQKRQTDLTPERKARLNQLDLVWTRMETRWEDFFVKLAEYGKEHGDVNILHTEDKFLASWIKAQRRKKRQGLLSAERIEKLEQIGFIWKAEDLLKTAYGRTQRTFENFALSVLRSVGRPMRSDELIEQFRKRGHPIPGNEVRTAWNRLWTARKKGILANYPKLGYWIAGEPLSEQAKQDAAIAARARPKRHGPSLRVINRGRKKGRAPALTPKDVRQAEKLLLEGKSRLQVAVILGGISQATLGKYIPGGISSLKAKHPTVVIPKRPYISRPRKPGAKPLGRPPVITVDQARQMAEMTAQGKTISEIARSMGLKRTTVHNHLRKASDAAARQSAPPRRHDLRARERTRTLKKITMTNGLRD